MWPCYGVHITVWHSQPVYSLIHPYISQISFQKSFYGDLFLFFFDCYIAALLIILFEILNLLSPLPIHLWLMHHPSMCTDEWCPTASNLFSQSSPQKSAGVMSQLRSTPSSNCPPPEKFLATGGCFIRNMYCVTVLGCLKKEKDEQF